MSIFRLALRNLTHKPGTTALSLILAALGAGLISLLLLVSWQLEQQFERNLAGIDLVVGAKGSPLQLILSSMYHVDAPTGNIPIQGVHPFMNPAHPYVDKAVPLSLGDSHRGRRIVGTTPDLVRLYADSSEATNPDFPGLAQGRGWTEVLDAVAGSRVAEELQLELGTTFHGSHGLEEDSTLIHDDVQPFEVVGILKPTGSVLDQLILTANQSVWAVHDGHDHDGHDHDRHDHEGHDHEGHDHDGHDHDGHDHGDHDGHDHGDHDEHDHGNHEGHDHSDLDGHDHDDHEGHDHGDHEGHDHSSISSNPRYDLSRPLTDFPEEQITSLLMTFKGNSVFSLNIQRSINENSNFQAATPAIEINRLYETMGPGETILRRLALAIVLVSVFSIFISLYSSLAERRKELALMRSLGAGPAKLFGLLLTEGVILAFGGALIGVLLSHLGLYFIAEYVSAEYRYDFQAFFLLPAEIKLLAAALGIGALAALIPAWQAAKTDVHATLAE